MRLVEGRREGLRHDARVEEVVLVGCVSRAGLDVCVTFNSGLQYMQWKARFILIDKTIFS